MNYHTMEYWCKCYEYSNWQGQLYTWRRSHACQIFFMIHLGRRKPWLQCNRKSYTCWFWVLMDHTTKVIYQVQVSRGFSLCTRAALNHAPSWVTSVAKPTLPGQRWFLLTRLLMWKQNLKCQNAQLVEPRWLSLLFAHPGHSCVEPLPEEHHF